MMVFRGDHGPPAGALNSHSMGQNDGHGWPLSSAGKAVLYKGKIGLGGRCQRHIGYRVILEQDRIG